MSETRRGAQPSTPEGAREGARHDGPGSWLSWPLRFVWFWLWYARELVSSSLTVLKDNLTPGQNSRPGIARIDTACRTDAEITLLAALITLTPGTLTLGTTLEDGRGPVPDEERTTRRQVAADARITRVLYVHGLYNDDADDLRVDIHDMERHLLHGWRRDGGPR